MTAGLQVMQTFRYQTDFSSVSLTISHDFDTPGDDCLITSELKLILLVRGSSDGIAIR
jgi:hypothetical protein